MMLSALLRVPNSTNWRAREVELWYRSVRKTLMVCLLVGPPIRLLKQSSMFTNPDFALPFYSVVVGFIYACYVFMFPVKGEWAQKVQMSILINLLQAYILASGVIIAPTCTDTWPFAGAVVFFFYEMRSFNSRLVNFLLLAKHCLAWHFALKYGTAQDKCELPWLTASLVCLTLYVVGAEMETKTEEFYKYCETCKQQERNLMSILMSIPEGIAVITSDLQVVCNNDKFKETLQCPSINLIGTRMTNTYCLQTIKSTAESTTSLWSKLEAFISSSTLEATLGITHFSSHYYEWKCTRSIWENKTAYILTVSDITSWVSDQRKLQQESAFNTLLVRFASHELRTPANAILNLVQRTAEAENLADEQREEMKIVIVSTQMLVSVVNDLLDYTRIQMEKLTLVKQNFDIRNAIREVASLVELQCKHKGIEIVTKIDNFVPEIVYSDPNRLKQILLNLLKNAVRYTFHGTIRLIASITDNHALKFSIKDTGIGLSSQLQSSLQACFRSSQRDFQSVPSDNVLGLYISNILATSLGSTSIEFSSHLGKGSEFSFEICINAEKVSKQTYYSDCTSREIAEERDLECSVHSYDISGGKSLANAGLSSVMIVDDVEFNRVVLRKMLLNLNIRADEAYSGLRAVSMIRAAVRRGHFYRLILMDVEMPEMDGIEATRAIRAMESSGELLLRTKIVACSAHRSREDIERCLNAGMDSYLEKPVSNDLLREEVIE